MLKICMFMYCLVGNDEIDGEKKGWEINLMRHIK